MADLKFEVDASALASLFGELRKEVEQDIKTAVKGLSTQVHGMIQTLAKGDLAKDAAGDKDRLNSTLNIYLGNLSSPEETSEGVWVISLSKPALFIEEGLKAHDMKPELTKNGKVSAKGFKYKIIPFQYSTKPQDTAVEAKEMVQEIKDKLSKKKIPFSKIEYEKDGKTPKEGRLHDLRWAVNDVKGGSKIPGKGNTPRLKGLSIYQTVKDGNVRRDVLTFRTVSMGPGSEGKWMHPGKPGKEYMNKAMDQAQQLWDNKIWPQIQEKWGK